MPISTPSRFGTLGPTRAALVMRAAALLVTCAAIAVAQPAASSRLPTSAEVRRAMDLSLALRVGTLGYGAEVGKLVTGRLGIRVAGYFFTYNQTPGFDGLTYDARLRSRNASVLVDLFPARRGKFHFTGGIVAGSSALDATALTRADGLYRVNGRTYAATDIGVLTIRTALPSTRPYAGFGWGTPAKNSGGLGFSTDVGVAIGRPMVTYRTTAAGPRAAQLEADLQVERTRIQQKIDGYLKIYPVLNFGLTQRF